MKVNWQGYIVGEGIGDRGSAPVIGWSSALGKFTVKPMSYLSGVVSDDGSTCFVASNEYLGEWRTTDPPTIPSRKWRYPQIVGHGARMWYSGLLSRVFIDAADGQLVTVPISRDSRQPAIVLRLPDSVAVEIPPRSERGYYLQICDSRFVLVSFNLLTGRQLRRRVIPSFSGREVHFAICSSATGQDVAVSNGRTVFFFKGGGLSSTGKVKAPFTPPTLQKRGAATY